MDRAELAERMQWARECHLDWARLQESRRRAGKKAIPHVGAETFHRRWVKVYDAVLRLLAKKS